MFLACPLLTTVPSFLFFLLQWVIERDERVRNAQVAYDANQKEIARLQAFVDRSVRTYIEVICS